MLSFLRRVWLKPVLFVLAVCADLIRGAKDKNLKVKGPVRMPTKVRIAWIGCGGRPQGPWATQGLRTA